MSDTRTPEQRRRIMSAIRQKDTSPELALRAALHAKGIRGWRLHYKAVRGKPDLAWPGLKVAVFVDGAFWHGHPSRHTPGRSGKFWDDKIARNVERDREVDAELRDAGWEVVRVWDFEVRKQIDDVVGRVVPILAGRLPRHPTALWQSALLDQGEPGGTGRDGRAVVEGMGPHDDTRPNPNDPALRTDRHPDRPAPVLGSPPMETYAAPAERRTGLLAARRPIAIDLFAGAGGLSLGLEQAGFDVVAAVEYDPVHAATHEYNFPRTTILRADVSDLSAELLLDAAREGLERHGGDPEEWDGTIDLIAGGPPCQGFSEIGKRLVDDPRNQLVFHFKRLVAEVQPRYVLMENVPGMAMGENHGTLARLVGEFEEAGYNFPAARAHRVLNAADYGVPQERHRLFLIGARDGEQIIAPPAPTVAPVPKRAAVMEFPNATGLPSGPTVWDAIGDLPNPNRYPRLKGTDEVWLSQSAVGEMEAAASAYARALHERGPVDFSHARAWNPALLTGSWRTEHSEESIRRFRSTDPGEVEPVSRYYKLDPGGLCNTLRAGSGRERGAFTSPRPIHPTAQRVLTNREAARLHSFPDWFRLHATKWHGFRQIGNSVAPLVGRAVGASIVAALGVEPFVPDDVLQRPTTAELLRLNMTQAAAHYGAEPGSFPGPRSRETSEPLEESETISPPSRSREPLAPADRGLRSVA